MEQILNYVKPELVVVAIVLYFVGIGLKNTEKIFQRYSVLLELLSAVSTW